MAGNPNFKPYVVDEGGNPVSGIPRSTGTIFYRYETRIVDRMPVQKRPRSKSALEKLKEVIKVPEELLRVPGVVLGAPRARPVSWGAAPRGEGRYYYVDQYGRTIETTVTRMPHPPAPNPSGGNMMLSSPGLPASGGKVSGTSKVVKDKEAVAEAAERLNHAALFARIGSGGGSGSSGGTSSGPGASGASCLGSGTSGANSSGIGPSGGSGASELLGSGGSGGKSSAFGGFSGGSSLFDW